VNNNYNSNTVVKLDFAVVEQADGRVKSLESNCNVQLLSGIHKLDKASKDYKGLATADVEVRNFKKIRFSPVKLKVILRIVKRGG
jgi:hypothetical protein